MLRLTLLVVFAVLALPTTGIAGVGQTSIFYYPWWGTPQKDGKYMHWNKGGHLPPALVAAEIRSAPQRHWPGNRIEPERERLACAPAWQRAVR